MGVSKSVYLVGSLILAHQLAPKDFGLVAIATVAITTLMAATETGMNGALVQASARSQTDYDVAWTIGLLRGSGVCVLLILCAPWIAALFGDQRAVSLVRLMALWPLLSSMLSPRQADLIRELRFSKLALIAIAAAGIDTVIAITLAGTLGGTAIVLGKLAGATTLTVSSYVVAPYRPRFRPSYASARHLVAFGRWMFAIGLTGVTSELLIKVLISRGLGVASLGLFSMSDKLSESPSQLANEAIGGVAFPLYSRLRDDPPRLQAAFRAHLTGLMFFLLPASALLISLALPLQQRILGGNWAGASSVIVLLTLGFLFEFVFSAIYYLLQALGAGARLFLVELAQYLTLIALVSVLTASFGLAGIGTARIVTSLVVVLAGVRAIPADLRRTALCIVRPGLILAVLAMLAGVAARLCTMFVSDVGGIVLGAAVGATIFVALAWLADQPLRVGVRACLSLFFPVLASNEERLCPTP